MKRLRRITCLIFIASCALFGVYTVKVKMVEDHKAPVISCEKDEISVSVEDGESALLEGITAKDNRDGDLTDSVRIASTSHFITGNKRKVSYVVFDSANLVGTYERTVEYTDYVSPRIYLKKAMRYKISEYENVNLNEYLEAEDCLDGDLTSQVRTIINNYFGSEAGSYPITLQVSNSAGDVCSVPVDVTLVDSSDGDENRKYYPVLSDYIVYTSVNRKISPRDYIAGLEINGVEYLYEDNSEILSGTKKNIEVSDDDVDYKNEGVYPIEFSYETEEGIKGVTTMYVVVEGE